MFTWIPIYKEIAIKLLSYKNDRKYLIDLLLRMQQKGLVILALNDKSKAGEEFDITLRDIDPFTFFANFNRKIKEDNKRDIISFIKNEWELKSEIPEDFIGIPIVNNQKVWFFSIEYKRGKEDINLLWKIFEQGMNKSIDNISEEIFNQCLEIRGVSSNLAIGLYWTNPENFIPMDANTKEYLKSNYEIEKVDLKKIKYAGYKEIIKKVRSESKKPFYELSYEAWNTNNEETFDFQDEIITKFITSSLYKHFKKNVLGAKTKREKEAWSLIESNKGKITAAILEQVIKLVDTHEEKSGWFGQMLKGNNRNLILNNSDERINDWFTTLLFSDKEAEEAIEECLTDSKLKGANIGFISLILYLSSPHEYNIYIPSIAEKTIELITDFSLKEYPTLVEKYSAFNSTMIQLVEEYSMDPNEVDWFVNNIQLYYADNNKDITTKENNLSDNKMGLNTILYGPPGTGKTYETISRAVQIVDDIEDNEYIEKYPTREEVRKKYQEYLELKKIRFVTFHQSFSYEDFVEGIKPVLSKDKGDDIPELGYRIENGIFKSICEDAQFPENTTFESAYNKLIEDLVESQRKIALDLTGEEILIYSHPNGIDLKVDNSVYMKNITKEGLEYTSRSNIFAGVWGKYYRAIFKLLSEKYGYNQNQKDKIGNYVLIIDEINRGNIASIFGELITLIETDKRKGAIEELEVMLPYSKTKFSVPNNVYIIGTMNTADRSVEALDTALRRRFDFVEVQPNYDLINPSSLVVSLWQQYEKVRNWFKEPFYSKAIRLYEFLGFKDPEFKESAKYWDEIVDNYWDIDRGRLISENEFNGFRPDLMLVKINQRIERLLDSDHCIGHAYFMSLSDCEDPLLELRYIFKNKIIPLLKEYFYGDLAKIGLILGKDFIEYETINDKGNIFADFDYDNIDEFEEIKPIKIKDVDLLDLSSFRKIYEQKQQK